MRKKISLNLELVLYRRASAIQLLNDHHAANNTTAKHEIAWNFRHSWNKCFQNPSRVDICEGEPTGYSWRGWFFLKLYISRAIALRRVLSRVPEEMSDRRTFLETIKVSNCNDIWVKRRFTCLILIVALVFALVNKIRQKVSGNDQDLVSLWWIVPRKTLFYPSLM